MNDQAIEQALKSIFSETDLHAVLGAVYAAQAGAGNIGRAEALVRGVNPKHAIKQADRFLSNDGFEVAVALRDLVRFVLGKRWKVTVSLDWAVYEGGDTHRIALNLITRHGRAMPLAWKTVPASELKDHRNDHEDELVRLFKKLLPQTIRQVVVIADRGFFGDVNLYDMLTGELGFDYVLRFREGLVQVGASQEVRRAGAQVQVVGARQRPALALGPLGESERQVVQRGGAGGCPARTRERRGSAAELGPKREARLRRKKSSRPIGF